MIGISDIKKTYRVSDMKKIFGSEAKLIRQFWLIDWCLTPTQNPLDST